MNSNETFPVTWVIGIAVVLVAGLFAYTKYQGAVKEKEHLACEALVNEKSMDSPAFRKALADLETADTIGAISRCATVLGLPGADK
jgi:hypothetical protein